MGKTTVYLPDELLNTLEKKTQEDDLKKSQLVQRALKRYFEAEQDEEPDTIAIKQEQLEARLDTIEKTQDALLDKLELHVKKPKEVKEEEKVILMEEGEEEEEEEEY
jgi:metal-responsive CopG/Arc/MetJ family transcriptional regulator